MPLAKVQAHAREYNSAYWTDVAIGKGAFSALTKWAVEVMALRQGGSSGSQGPLAAYNILWVDGGPCLFR